MKNAFLIIVEKVGLFCARIYGVLSLRRAGSRRKTLPNEHGARRDNEAS